MVFVQTDIKAWLRLKRNYPRGVQGRPSGQKAIPGIGQERKDFPGRGWGEAYPVIRS